MPRKRKNSNTSKKPQLLFQENPINGIKHHYGTPVKSALNPKHVPTEAPGGNATCQWVTPQFDAAMQLHLPTRRRKRQQSGSSVQQSVLGRSSLLMAKKTSVCKFPSLTFRNTVMLHHKAAQQSLAVPLNKIKCQTGRLSDNKEVTAARPCKEAHSSLSLLSTTETCESQRTPLPEMEIDRHDVAQSVRGYRSPDIENIFTPPAYHTPEAGDCGVGNVESDLLGRLIFSPTPNDSEPQGDTLVKDTPEQDYGVKVTWRRRKGIMKYLKDHGQLSSGEALVRS
ncbi:RAD9, HUS1, RAD1-interacting nuclear orphan protein 1 [Amia ocellicauda]|uniref:RAD9, HUS1, RAD1-interacting nuclear orphan protein 1 n=1 Tax=Amia ocellicauda TaxID=2972642 RepID=UPI00346486FF|nr:RHNO1 protein [Amia calva]